MGVIYRNTTFQVHKEQSIGKKNTLKSEDPCPKQSNEICTSSKSIKLNKQFVIRARRTSVKINKNQKNMQTKKNPTNLQTFMQSVSTNKQPLKER